MKFLINDFFSKCDQIRSFLQIWSDLLKKSFPYYYSLLFPYCYESFSQWKTSFCAVKSENSESLKKDSEQLESSSTNVHMVSNNLLRVFCKLSCLLCLLSSYQLKNTL